MYNEVRIVIKLTNTDERVGFSMSGGVPECSEVTVNIVVPGRLKIWFLAE